MRKPIFLNTDFHFLNILVWFTSITIWKPINRLSDTNIQQFTKVFNHTLIYHQSTVRKRRDPAILDREELLLQLKIEEIFFSEEFCYPILKIISNVANTNLCSLKQTTQKFHSTSLRITFWYLNLQEPIVPPLNKSDLSLYK